MGDDANAMVLTGRDRASARELAILLVLVCVGVIIAIPISGGSLGDVLLPVLAAVSAALLAALFAALFDVLPSTLTFLRDEGELRLRYGLGLRTRTLKLPARVEIGRLRTLRPSPGMQGQDWANDEVDDGVYLRLVADRGRITVASRKGTAFRKHWAPDSWHAAAPTRRSDIALSREDRVRLEYALAETGLLRARDA